MYPERLTQAGAYLAELLRDNNKPVVTVFEFHRLVWHMYTAPTDRKLFLRSRVPAASDTARLRQSLKKKSLISPDPDYGPRAIRVLSVPDLPAEEIICLLDPACHVSHLSAMQRWGLTDRVPEKLILTRPDQSGIRQCLQKHMSKFSEAGADNPFPLKVITHPPVVRRRPVLMHSSKTAGASISVRGSNVRISTIGQTFLDMIQKPDLCGGMSHVLDVWEEHAQTYLEDIVSAVGAASSNISRSRAGYILEERLGLKHQVVETWKAFGQRGGSRKLDPDKDFSPVFSETWMLSLNV